jgi:hypothetical protein
MQYYRCRCWRCESWETMSPARCDGCAECHTTLESAPSRHREPSPHEWRTEWVIYQQSGERSQERICLACHTREPVPTPTEEGQG